MEWVEVARCEEVAGALEAIAMECNCPIEGGAVRPRQPAKGHLHVRPSETDQNMLLAMAQ